MISIISREHMSESPKLKAVNFAHVEYVENLRNAQQKLDQSWKKAESARLVSFLHDNFEAYKLNFLLLIFVKVTEAAFLLTV